MRMIIPFFTKSTVPALLAISLLALGSGCSKRVEDRPSVAQAGGGLAQLDTELGLPDATLGAPISSMSGLETVEEVGAWGTYRRPGDRKRYAKWPVQEIVYNFYKGNLYSIRMEISEPGAVKGILKHLYAQYGPETNTRRRRFETSNAALVVREWDGERSNLVFKYADNYAGGTLILVDAVQWKKLDEPRQTTNKVLQEAMSGSILNLDFD